MASLSLSLSLSEIGREIKLSQKLIVDYKEELKRSRVIRRHRQEYDAMAKVLWQTIIIPLTCFVARKSKPHRAPHCPAVLHPTAPCLLR